MNTKRPPRHVIDILFVLAVFALFAISSVLLIAIGVSVYSQSVSAMDENNTVRTPYAYVAEKIRRSDADAAVENGVFGDSDALFLRYSVDGISYTTSLYVYEGMLTELVARSDLSFPPSAGQPVMELEKLKCVPVSDDLLQITLVRQGGDERVLYAHIRSTASTGGITSNH